MSRPSERPVVLVTGVGACGVGEGLAKAVRIADRYRLVAVNANPNAPMLFEADDGFLVPPATDPAYLEVLVEVCRMKSVEVLLPGSEPELMVLAEHQEAFAAMGILLIANPAPVVRTFQDKWLTYTALRDAGLATSTTFLPHAQPELLKRAAFPLVLKPRFGHASQFVFVVGSLEEACTVADFFGHKKIEPVAQEHVAGDDEEFTASALVGKDGRLLGSIAMRRRLLGGFSQLVEIDDFPAVRLEAERLAASLGVRGPVNVQCRLRDGVCWIFEVNPRFSGSAPFRAMAGFNEPDILIRHNLLGHDGGDASVRHGLIGIRRLEEVLLPADVFHSVRKAGSVDQTR